MIRGIKGRVNPSLRLRPPELHRSNSVELLRWSSSGLLYVKYHSFDEGRSSVFLQFCTNAARKPGAMQSWRTRRELKVSEDISSADREVGLQSFCERGPGSLDELIQVFSEVSDDCENDLS